MVNRQTVCQLTRLAKHNVTVRQHMHQQLPFPAHGGKFVLARAGGMVGFVMAFTT